MTSRRNKHRLYQEAGMASLADDFDLEASERMVALACATWTVGEKGDANRVMAVAASYLEFIDPLADPSFGGREIHIGKPGK